MNFKNLSMIPDFNDSLFSDRFNKIDKLFSKLTGNIPMNKFPNYNIKKIKNYFILMISLPGWKNNELEIYLINNQLNIKGTKIKKNKKIYWIYKNIIKNNFNISFNIPQNSIIKNAKLKYGILSIKIEQKIPENQKTKKIQIN